ARSARWKLNVPLIHGDYAHILDWPYEKGLINAPSMLLYGGRSVYTSPEARSAMRGLAPEMREHCIESAGHWVHAEAPDETISVIREFLGA
ncbi:MAG: hypothetical protein EA383_00600, partial [Spirochaetaceae bacterium]